METFLIAHVPVEALQSVSRMNMTMGNDYHPIAQTDMMPCKNKISIGWIGVEARNITSSSKNVFGHGILESYLCKMEGLKAYKALTGYKNKLQQDANAVSLECESAQKHTSSLWGILVSTRHRPALHP